MLASSKSKGRACKIAVCESWKTTSHHHKDDPPVKHRIKSTNQETHQEVSTKQAVSRPAGCLRSKLCLQTYTHEYNSSGLHLIVEFSSL
ncbi:hypothetical protein MPTK2_3g12770 [Marchantia polymorpha subsp. ruderalis]